MPGQSEAVGTTILDLVGQAIAAADEVEFQADPGRYRRLALAALGPLRKPTEAMVYSSHQAASFDARCALEYSTVKAIPCRMRCLLTSFRSDGSISA